MAGASKFTNRDRLQRKFKSVPLAIRKALRAQNNINAADLVEVQKDFAPIQDGALVSSIKARDVSDNNTRISARVTAGSRDAPYASWVEFGTGKSAAHPFFWPAYRLMRRRMKSRMTRAAKKAIAEAVK